MDINQVVLYHSFKHHLQVGVGWIKQNKYQWTPNLKSTLSSIGNSQLDFYIGDISALEVEEQVKKLLSTENLINKDRYKTWLEMNGNYREIELSDGSMWTLRFLDKNQYVHLHPSRYSKQTLRIKANTLKSVMCTMLFETSYDKINLSLINHIRINKLEISPIDISKNHSELIKVYKLFRNCFIL